MGDNLPPRTSRSLTRSLSASLQAQVTGPRIPFQWGEAPSGVRPRSRSDSRSSSSTPIVPTHPGPQSHLPAPEEGHPTSGHSASTLSIDGRMPVTGPLGQQAECRHSQVPPSGEVHQAPLPLGGQGGASSHSLAGPSCTAAVPNVAHSAYNPSGGSLRDVGGLRSCATEGSGRTAQPSQPGGGLMQEGGDQPLPTAGGSAPSPPPWSELSGWNVQGGASSRIAGGVGNHTTFRDASAAIPAEGGPKPPPPSQTVMFCGMGRPLQTLQRASVWIDSRSLSGWMVLQCPHPLGSQERCLGSQEAARCCTNCRRGSSCYSTPWGQPCERAPGASGAATCKGTGQ